MYLISSTNFVWSISHSKKNWAKYDKKCVFIQSNRHSSEFCVTWIFSTGFFFLFRKIRKCKISWMYPPSDSRDFSVYTDGYRQTWRTHASMFANFAKAPWKWRWSLPNRAATLSTKKLSDHLICHMTDKALSLRNYSQRAEKFKFTLTWTLNADVRAIRGITAPKSGSYSSMKMHIY